MSEEQEMNLTPEERAIEARLAGLKPKAVNISVHEAILSARLRKARRQVWVWRAAAGLLLAIMPAVYLHRPAEVKDPIIRESPVMVEEKPAEIRTEPTPRMLPVMLRGDSYFAMRNRMILTGNVDAPAKKTSRGGSKSAPLESSTAWDLRRKWID